LAATLGSGQISLDPQWDGKRVDGMHSASLAWAMDGHPHAVNMLPTLIEHFD